MEVFMVVVVVFVHMLVCPLITQMVVVLPHFMDE